MSDAQRLADLERLEALEAQEAQAPAQPDLPEGVSEVKPGQTHFRNPETGRTEPLPEHLQSTEPAPIDAFVAGAVEGVPFAKDAIAAGKALMEDNTPYTFGERYNNNLEEWNKEVKKAEDKYPVAFTTGDIGSGIATGGKLTSIGRDIAFGAVSGISREEARFDSPVEVIENAAKGAGAALVGSGVGRAVSSTLGFIGRQIGMVAAKGTKEAVGAISQPAKAELGNHINKFYNRAGEKTNLQAATEWSEDLFNSTVDGVPFFVKGQTFEQTFKKAGRKKQIVGEKISQTLRTIDQTLGKDAVDSEAVYSRILSDTKINDMINSLDPTTQRVGKKLLADLDQVFKTKSVKKIPQKIKVPNNQVGGFQEKIVMVDEVTEGFKDFSMQALHKYKVDLAQSVRRSLESGASDNTTLALRSRLGVISGILDETVEDAIASNKVNEQYIQSLSSLNKEWANMNIIEDFAGTQQWSFTKGPIESFQQNISTGGLSIAATKYVTGTPAPVAAGITIAAHQILRSEKLPVRMALGLKNIADLAKVQPDSPLIKRVVMGASLSSDDFRTYLGSAMAELNLMGSAVARSTDDVMNKSDDILEAMEYHNKEVASELRQAIKSGDPAVIGPIMDQISKLPETKPFIKQGMGWDGKVYDPEDKAQLESQVDSADIGLIQKLKHKKALRESGLIPQIQPENKVIDRFIKRNKKEPRF